MHSVDPGILKAFLLHRDGNFRLFGWFYQKN